jgi:prepilin-type N-terminal cleavage/methylation domain-containing protein
MRRTVALARFSLRGEPSNGFSLIEILVSLVIFATVILSVAMLLPQARLETRTSEVTSRMNRMAQTKIEQLRAANYDGPELTAGWHVEESHMLMARRQSGGRSEYTLRWHVQNDQPASGMKTVDVEVTYQPQGSGGNPVPSRVLTLRTFIVDKGESAGSGTDDDPGGGLPL